MDSNTLQGGQIGWFLKDIGYKFHNKSRPNILMTIYKKHHFLVKYTMAAIGQPLEKLGNFL